MDQSGTGSTLAPRSFQVLLGISLIVVIVSGYLWWPFTVDDSYISYQYARNLAEGQGPVFNPGERVEGFSSPGWVVVLAVATRAGLDPVPVSKALGLAATLALVFLFGLALRRAGSGPILSGVGCLVLASVSSLSIYSVSGMETMAYALAVGAATLLPPRPGARAAGAWLAAMGIVAMVVFRPEGLLPAILMSLFLLAIERGRPMRRGLATAWLVLAALLVTRWIYYGQLLPNTYVAKPSPLMKLLIGFHLKYGLLELIGNVRDNLFPAIGGMGGTGAILLVLLGLTATGGSRAKAGAAIGAISGLVFVLYARGDWMAGQRFAIPYAAPFLFLAVLGAGALLRRLDGAGGKLFASSAVILALVWCGWSWGQTAGLHTRFRHQRVNPALNAGKYLQIGEWLKENAGPGDRVLAFEVGAVGYGSRLHVIDHEGLITPEIARIMQAADGDLAEIRFGEDPEGMGKVVEYCARQRPEWWLARSFEDLPLVVGERVPAEAPLFALERAILEEMGDSMVLAEVFEMRPPTPGGLVDRYLLLRRVE